MILRSSFLILHVGVLLAASQSEIKGPPRAETKVVKKIGHPGENIRLQCPIEGFPPPLIEWSKGNEAIDFTWSRYKVNKKVLKIKSAELDDTGVFSCKGVNGFGSDAVRIELIIVEPPKFSNSNGDGANEGLISELAQPVFTPETKNAPRVHRKSVGDAFQLACEALGSPDPKLDWLKDGQMVSDSVKRLDGYSSILDIKYLSSSDSGSYTCRASNLLGQVDINFTLEVSGSSYNPGINKMSDGLSTIVTEAGPRNGTVDQGSNAVLFCKVKSLVSPQVQWMRKLDSTEPTSDDGDSAFVIKVAGERFRMLESKDKDAAASIERVQAGEFIDRLILKNVQAQDSGMYICFVTSNGIGQLTYKAVYLNVVPTPNGLLPNGQVHSSSVSLSTPETSSPSLSIVLTIVSCLLFFVFLTIGSIVYIIKKRGKGWSNKKDNGESGDLGKGESQHPPSTVPQSLHVSCESRPFLMLSGSDKMLQPPYYPGPHQQHLNSYSDTQPPLSSIGSQWSSTVYPLSSFGQHKSFQSKSVPLSHKKTNLMSSASSRDYENQQVRLNGDYEFPLHCVTPVSRPLDRSNVYEVPYSHLFRSQYSPGEEWTEFNPRSVPLGLTPKLRPQPLGGSTSISSHSIPMHNSNSMQAKFQDYESCYQ